MKKRSPVLIFFVVVALGLVFVSLTTDEVANDITLGLDLQGGFEILYEVQPVDEDQEMTSDLLIETQSVLNNRINELGVSEPELRIEGDDRIRVRLAGIDDQDEARDMLSTQAQLSFRDTNDNFLIGGQHLEQGAAQPAFNEANQPIVQIGFNDADLAREVTTDLLGEPMVIWLDFDEDVHSFEEEFEKQQAGEEPAYISAPTVRAVLSSEGQITGMESYEEAEELASLLNAGALPTDLEELTARSVGASLGEQAMNYTIIAGIIGGILIALYMIAYYRISGFVAALSLIFYVYFILLVFNWMNAVLTLPGIAALVLGVGMAVDANILTSERIKEEIRSGKTIMSSFRAGSKRALRTIMDANITTVIAASVMFYFGDFSVQGFGLMLIVTIILSFLTAVLGSRLLLGLLVASRFFDRKPRWFGVKESEISEL